MGTLERKMLLSMLVIKQPREVSSLGLKLDYSLVLWQRITSDSTLMTALIKYRRASWELLEW